MNEEVTKPQPVDNSHLDAGIAARNVKAESEKPAEKDPAQQTPETETVEQNEPEGSAASETDDATVQRPKNKGVGKRIDELTREKYDAQRERDYWREQAMRNQQQPAPRQEASKQPEATGEPTIEDHNFDPAAYQRAWYEWKRGEEKKAEQAEKEVQSKQDRAAKYRESVQKFAEANPDFFDVVHDHLPVTEVMAEAITETDDPAAIAYYLGKNPEEAAKIAGLSPAGVNRAIGRIEAQLSASAPEVPRQPAPKTVTKAPPPVTTLSGAPAVVKSLDDMSMDEYDAERRKQRKARGLR